MLSGATVSMFGHVSGMTLATPRALFAFGRDGVLPAQLARVHPRFRTPYIAIAVQSAITFLLAATSSFARLAILANVSVLLLYLLCCVAAWVLRRRDVRAGGTPFRVPGGALVPALACAVILWLLTGATLGELVVVGVVIAAAALVFLLSSARHGRAPSVP